MSCFWFFDIFGKFEVFGIHSRLDIEKFPENPFPSFCTCHFRTHDSSSTQDLHLRRTRLFLKQWRSCMSSPCSRKNAVYGERSPPTSNYSRCIYYQEHIFHHSNFPSSILHCRAHGRDLGCTAQAWGKSRQHFVAHLFGHLEKNTASRVG